MLAFVALVATTITACLQIMGRTLGIMDNFPHGTPSQIGFLTSVTMTLSRDYQYH